VRPPSIEPFADDHLDAAGELLAERHRRHREAEPLLPAAYEEPTAARAEVEALWRADDTPGAVAIRDGRVVGYVVGRRKEDTWGANVWVDPAGHAVGWAEDVRDLYAAVAERWVRSGWNAHYVVVPASDAELVASWFRLSFGQQHAYGVRELPADPSWPESVREAETGDIDELLRISPVLAEHQLLAPVFSTLAFDEDEAELREEWAKDIAAQDVACLVVERDGRIVSGFFLCPLEHSSMHTGLARPEHMSFLAWAATDPEARGTGAGVALTDAGFAWAREHGYEAMVTDWRVTNLLSSRFWPARGFRTTFLRLHRLIAPA
jgi:ribosomal protein S18 acetylase RimI-like enzyme